MAILDRNSGVFSATTAITVSRSSGSYGTGTIVVVLFIANTTFATPGGWNLRHTSVSVMGNYAFDRTAAGEASYAFTAGAAGSGQWYAWELTAGSTYVTGTLTQGGAASSFATASITPTAGDRHLLAAVGGLHDTLSRSVTAWSNSFVSNGLGGAATVQDRPFSGAAELDVTANGSGSYSTTGTFNGSSVGASGGGMLAYNRIAGDTTAPSVPAGLATTAVGSTTADLSWSAATDDTAVTGYELQVIGP